MLALVASFVAALSVLCVVSMPGNAFAWIALGAGCLAVWALVSAPDAIARDTVASSTVAP